MRTTRILGRRWYDLGADVNWPTYGGVWGRPLSPTLDRWAVIRLDTPDCECFPSTAVAVTVHLADVTAEVLRAGGVPLDGRDEFGDPIPPLEYAAAKVAAYINHWGAHGVTGGDEFTHADARIARARAARLLTE